MKKSTDSSSPFLRFLDRTDRMILRGWRFFTSLKCGIFLLSLIGIVAIWGTMGYASNAALEDNSIPMARTMVFEHPYFIALLLLFALNLIISTWHVTRMSLGIWWKKDFKRAASFYDKTRSPSATIPVEGSPEEIERALHRRFTRVHRDGNAFFAHRGILSRIGPTIVHAGILTVIGAIVIKAMLLWNGKVITEGRFVAAEGEELPFIIQPIALEQQLSPENQRATPIDAWVKVLDFDEIMHPNSQVPAHFRSLIQVRDPRTQEITVAQLDMNHSLSVPTSRYGRLQFHQAGYQAIPDGDMPRINYDVRDTITGERIAVADASPGDRVRVGETDLFLETAGFNPGDRWRLYKASAPLEVMAEGLLSGGHTVEFSINPLEFYPDFGIDEATQEPVNRSNIPRNPALRTGILLDGRQLAETWLFYDPRLADAMPEVHPRFSMRLLDVRVPPDVDLAEIDWNRPGAAVFDIAIDDKNDGTRREQAFNIGETSPPVSYRTVVAHEGVILGTESNYEVRVIGPTQRYITVLSVVNEPTVAYVKLGVGILLIGAMMTFIVRYRAFHGLYDPDSRTLRMALVPRWGQSPVREEFDSLMTLLSGGRGPLSTRYEPPPGETPEGIADSPEATPDLAGV